MAAYFMGIHPTLLKGRRFEHGRHVKKAEPAAQRMVDGSEPSVCRVHHVQRDIGYTGCTAQGGDLKTDAADRYVPVPDELRDLLVKARSLPDQYVFHNDKFKPLSQNSFRRIWSNLMPDAGCVVEREITELISRPADILKRLNLALIRTTSGTAT